MPILNIVGGGGIGKAAAQIALNLLDEDIRVCVGDISSHALKGVEKFVTAPRKKERLSTYLMSENQSDWEMNFNKSDVVLDCLPGNFAPMVAKLALKYNAHYVNLTEYVKETAEIKAMAEGASTGFILQTGLAPGYINIMAHGLYKDFCNKYDVEKVDRISMKVGALTRSATSPHFYGFTWSPIGVATEYVKDAIILRDHEVIKVPALSGIESILIDGHWYEDNFTSGGAADLPEAFSTRVKDLDYKTLRIPGHYRWVKEILNAAPYEEDRIAYLRKRMLDSIPRYDEDMVIMYVDVVGKDNHGNLRAMDRSLKIESCEIGGRVLSAIQSTTAAPLIECARLLLNSNKTGAILQSMLDPHEFMAGPVVSQVYG